MKGFLVVKNSYTLLFHVVIKVLKNTMHYKCWCGTEYHNLNLEKLNNIKS